MALGKYTEAETVLRECISIREKQSPQLWQLFHAKSLLGECLLGQRTFADAEPLLLAGYEGMEAREAFMPAYRKHELPAAADRLVQFYEATGKPETVAKWRSVRAKYGPVSAPFPREK